MCLREVHKFTEGILTKSRVVDSSVNSRTYASRPPSSDINGCTHTTAPASSTISPMQLTNTMNSIFNSLLLLLFLVSGFILLRMHISAARQKEMRTSKHLTEEEACQPARSRARTALASTNLSQIEYLEAQRPFYHDLSKSAKHSAYPLSFLECSLTFVVDLNDMSSGLRQNMQVGTLSLLGYLLSLWTSAAL